MRQATKKDLTTIRDKTTRFRDAIVYHLTRADLKDHGGHATISMEWDLNEAAKRDMIFKLTINSETAFIDLEELSAYTRLI